MKKIFKILFSSITNTLAKEHSIMLNGAFWKVRAVDSMLLTTLGHIEYVTINSNEIFYVTKATLNDGVEIILFYREGVFSFENIMYIEDLRNHFEYVIPNEVLQKDSIEYKQIIKDLEKHYIFITDIWHKQIKYI